MSKLRKDYEYVGWRKFVHWVNADLKEDYMPKEKSGAEKAERHSQVADHEKSNTWLAEVEHSDENNTLLRGRRWFQRNGVKVFQKVYRYLALAVALTIITVLLLTVSYLPEFGNADNPVNNNVSRRYIEQGLEETGAVNAVAGMILDYRAFDTLGESHVLFIAVCSVIILIRLDYDKNGKPGLKKIKAEENDRKFEPKNDSILQKAAFFLVPCIFIFGIYIILNGHLSPGGGFSGGAIIGAGLILYLNAFGFKKTERFFTYKTFKWVSFSALTFYAVAKTYAFFTGANGLESGIPLGTPGAILSSGLILPLDIAVGLVVACTMYAFYTMFRKGGM